MLIGKIFMATLWPNVAFWQHFKILWQQRRFHDLNFYVDFWKKSFKVIRPGKPFSLNFSSTKKSNKANQQGCCRKIVQRWVGGKRLSTADKNLKMFENAHSAGVQKRPSQSFQLQVLVLLSIKKCRNLHQSIAFVK